jgi:hypothetical protein
MVHADRHFGRLRVKGPVTVTSAFSKARPASARRNFMYEAKTALTISITISRWSRTPRDRRLSHIRGLDIAAVPTNVAARIYNKTEGGVSILAVIHSVCCISWKTAIP